MAKKLIDQSIDFMEEFFQTEYDLWVATLNMPDDSYFKYPPEAEEAMGYQWAHPYNKNYLKFYNELKSYLDPTNEKMRISLMPSKPFDLTKEGFEEKQERLGQQKKRIIYVVQHYNDPILKDLFYFYVNNIDSILDHGISAIFVVQHDDENGFKIIKKLTRCALCKGLGIYQAKLGDGKTEEKQCPDCFGAGSSEGRQPVKLQPKLIETKALKKPENDKTIELYNKLISKQ